MRTESEKKTKVTSLRLTDEQHNLIKKMADARDLKMSEYIIERTIHSHTLSPQVMVRIQNIVNKAYRVCAQFSPMDADQMQEEMNELWLLLR